jgi:hypothetical protein
MKTNYNITNDGDNIVYLDINVINNSNDRIPASFNINRSAPLLPHPNEEYLASVIRFTVPLTSQPLFLFFNNSNVVTFSYNGVDASAPLIFQKTEFNTDEEFEIGNVSLAGGVYQYQTMCNMMNTAFTTCYNALSLSSLGLCPYMVFDNINERFIIYAPLTWADTYPYTTASKPKIYLNKLLQTYFINFNNLTYDNKANNNNKDYLVIIQNTFNNIYTDGNGNKWYMNSQEWSGVQYTNSLSNLSIISNALPCIGDSLNNNYIQNSTAQSASLKVITDFEIIKGDAGSQRSLVQYQAQNYRYIDLVGRNLLYSIDFTFFTYYQELVNQYVNNQSLYPYQKLILNPYEVITMKIMFKRKTLNY